MQASRLSWPRRFPLVQFPNLPLALALLARLAARSLQGRERAGAEAVGFAAMSVWAYEEMRHGENWFRRLLGVAAAARLVGGLGARLARERT